MDTDSPVRRLVIVVLVSFFLGVSCSRKPQADNQQAGPTPDGPPTVVLVTDTSYSPLITAELSETIASSLPFSVQVKTIDLAPIRSDLSGVAAISRESGLNVLLTLLLVHEPQDPDNTFILLPEEKLGLINTSQLVRPNHSIPNWPARQAVVRASSRLLGLDDCPFPLCALHVRKPEEPDTIVQTRCPPCTMKLQSILAKRGLLPLSPAPPENP